MRFDIFLWIPSLNSNRFEVDVVDDGEEGGFSGATDDGGVGDGAVGVGGDVRLVVEYVMMMV